MPVRPKYKKSLHKRFAYGSTNLFDQSNRDGPTVPTCICVCSVCGYQESHTNSEDVHYCGGDTIEANWIKHHPVRMTWKD